MTSLKRSQIIYRNLIYSNKEQDEDPIEEGGEPIPVPRKRKIIIKKLKSESDSPDEAIDSDSDGINIPSAQKIPVERSDDIDSEIEPIENSLHFASDTIYEDEVMSQNAGLVDDPISEANSSQIRKEPANGEEETEIEDDIVTDSRTQKFVSSDTEEIDIDSKTQKFASSDSEEIDEVARTQELVSSEAEEIDNAGHEEFFKEEFIMMRFIEEKTNQLDMFDCGKVRVLLCEHIYTDGESTDKEFEQLLCGGRYNVIVSANQVKGDIEEGTPFIMKLPIFTFAHEQQFGVIAQNFFQVY